MRLIINQHGKFAVSAIRPGYFCVRVVHVGNIIVQIKAGETFPFQHGLVRNVAHYRCVVDHHDRKYGRVAVRQAPRIRRGKSDGFTAVPVRIRYADRGHMRLIVNLHGKFAVSAIRPGYFCVRVVHVGNIIVQIKAGETFPFLHGLIRNITDHRRIINRSDCKYRRITIRQAARIGGGKRDGLATVPVLVRCADRGHMGLIVNLHGKFAVSAIRPGYFCVRVVHVGNIIVQIKAGETFPFLHSLIRNITDHRRIVHSRNGKDGRVAVGQQSRVCSGKRDRFTAVPILIRRGDGCDMRDVIDGYNEVCIPAVRPTDFIVAVVLVGHIVIQIKLSELGAFFDGLIRYVADHRWMQGLNIGNIQAPIIDGTAVIVVGVIKHAQGPVSGGVQTVKYEQGVIRLKSAGIWTGSVRNARGRFVIQGSVGVRIPGLPIVIHNAGSGAVRSLQGHRQVFDMIGNADGGVQIHNLMMIGNGQTGCVIHIIIGNRNRHIAACVSLHGKIAHMVTQ